MGDGSGLRTVRADRSRGLRLIALHISVIWVAAIAGTGCVYFNSLYNANRLFDEGRKDVEEGRPGAGQASLAAAIEKAERILRDNPNSRWADDAVRLIVQARILREEWLEAAESSQQLLRYARSREDSVEVAGYLGTARLNLGEVEQADSLLSVALAGEEDEDVRVHLYLNRGRARVVLGRREAGESDLRTASELRPDWVEPRLDRVRLLVQLGRGDEAALQAGELFELPLNGAEQREVIALAEYLAAVSPETAVAALVDVESSTLRRDDRASLVKRRGDLEIELGRVDEGLADYETVRSIAPGSRAAVESEVAVIQRRIQNAAVPGELDGARAMLMQLSRVPAAQTSRDLGRLRDTLIRIDYWLATGGVGYLLAGEAARDELKAPRLARHVFLEYVKNEPNALWAPKAILAALDLTDLDSGAGEGPDEPGAEELRRTLLEDYADSAYVQQFTGGEGGQFTYEELEQGLRRQLDRLARLADQEVRKRTSGS